MRRRPTQADVARLAGVSQTVVSHVLNGTQPRSMTQATRDRVSAAMDELGYIPHQTARSLRLQRTNTIAVFVPDIVNPFYGLLVRGAQDEAHRYGYDLLTYTTDGHRDLELKALHVALSGRADGVIGSAFHLGSADIVPLLDRDVPVALLNRSDAVDADRSTTLDLIEVSDEIAARLMVGHLIDRGHRRIAIISGEPDTPPQQHREAGYRQALATAAIPVDEALIQTGDFTETGGYDRMLALLALDPRPTAVFAANDLIAIGALTACRERGVGVPDEIAIGGLDDIPAARLVYPSLTTINQRHDAIGRELIRLVLTRLRGDYTGPGRTLAGDFDLVVRDST